MIHFEVLKGILEQEIWYDFIKIMRTFLTLIFTLIPCAVSAKENLDESLVEEITEGIGTLSFKLNDDVTMNKVNVDGEEVSLINYFGEFDYFTDNFTKYGQLMQNLDGVEGWEYDSIFIIVDKKTNLIKAIEKITYLKKATLELYTEDTYNPIFVGNTMIENIEKHLLKLGYKEISKSDINFTNFDVLGKSVVFKKNNLIVLLGATYHEQFEDTPMGGMLTLITSESFYEENKDFYK